MHGFIQITVEEKRVLVAVSAITGVSDKGQNGCVLSLAPAISWLGSVAYVDQPYDEVLDLIEKA